MLSWVMNLGFAGGAPAAAPDGFSSGQFIYYYPWIWEIYDDGM